MRRFLTASAVLFATAWAIPAPAHAAPAAPAPPAPKPAGDDEDIILDEAEGDTPAKPAEGDKPAGEATTGTTGTAGAAGTGDIFGDEGAKKDAPPPGSGGKVKIGRAHV